MKQDRKRSHRTGTSGTIILLAAISRLFAQSPPVSPDRPWHSPEERQVISDAQRLPSRALSIEPNKAYSLAELIDLAEANNPETRVAWESARFAEVRAAQAEQQQARSALYPTLSATATPSAQSLYIMQQTLPWGHTADLTGGVAFNLSWTSIWRIIKGVSGSWPSLSRQFATIWSMTGSRIRCTSMVILWTLFHCWARWSTQPL
jgi:hypothetical protein